MKNQKYKIPCTYLMSGSYVVEAKSLKDAKDIVDKLPLPDNADYVEESFEVIDDEIEILD